MSLVVKHTFLEFIRTPDHKSGRPRGFTDTELLEDAFTDTELLESAGLIASSRAAVVAALASTQRASGATTSADCGARDSPVCGPSPACGPSEVFADWPVTPMLEALFEPEGLTEFTERGERVDLEATMEVKAVLGMGCAGEDGTCPDDANRWLPPATAEDVVFHQQPWVFVPFAEFQDCCAMQAPCWAEPTMWQPEVSSTRSTASSSGDVASSGDCGNGSIDGGNPMTETRTTVMLRNLPNAITRHTLIQMLENMGFGGQFDLVYIPVDFSTGAGLGYAFINLVSPCNVARLWESFDGLSQWGVAGDKVCSVSWSDPHQGLAAHVERYQNSPVMHPDVPDEWKPALFLHGARIDFPPPTKKLKAPKVRSKKSAETM